MKFVFSPHLIVGLPKITTYVIAVVFFLTVNSNIGAVTIAAQICLILLLMTKVIALQKTKKMQVMGQLVVS